MSVSGLRGEFVTCRGDLFLGNGTGFWIRPERSGYEGVLRGGEGLLTEGEAPVDEEERGERDAAVHHVKF